MSFYDQEGDVLGHIIFSEGIEVVKTRVDLIANTPLPTYVKDIQSFLGYVVFYRRYIKEFNKVAKPLSLLLAKDV